jgi:hypothetical protein
VAPPAPAVSVALPGAVPVGLSVRFPNVMR